MPSTNGHGPMQAIHWAIIYARVSGPEQIKGYSLAQQLERGRSWCVENGYKVLAEVVDAGYSGESLVRIKRLTFRFVDDFSLSAFGVSFDFALAHSVFSHAYPDLAFTAFRGIAETLAPQGKLFATFKEGAANPEGSGWLYPEMVPYTWERMNSIVEESGLVARRLDWMQPRQSWFVAAHPNAEGEIDDLSRRLRRPLPGSNAPSGSVSAEPRSRTTEAGC
jgi:hypothetical protein